MMPKDHKEGKVIFNGYHDMPEVKMTPVEELLMKYRQQVMNKIIKEMLSSKKHG